jgi:hypothetical protein
MAKRKEQVVKLREQDGIVYLKAICRLTEEEHKTLSDRLRYEAQQSGVNIVLVPFTAALTNEKGE